MRSLMNPYLNFKDSARQAMEFYHNIFGGKLDINTFGESHMSDDPATKDLIMHSMIEADNGITFMASDAPPGMADKPSENGTISLSGDNETELRGYWDRLAEGGTITMPISKAPWGDTFGMLTDKFGVRWMVNIAGKKA